MAERSLWEPEDPRVQSFALDYLTPHQRRARQNQRKKKFKVQKLFTLNQIRKCLVSHRRVALAKSIFIYLADDDVSGVRRLMGQARRDGVSMHGILHRLEQAVNGTYSAKDIAKTSLTWRSSPCGSEDKRFYMRCTRQQDFRERRRCTRRSGSARGATRSGNCLFDHTYEVPTVSLVGCRSSALPYLFPTRAFNADGVDSSWLMLPATVCNALYSPPLCR